MSKTAKELRAWNWRYAESFEEQLSADAKNAIVGAMCNLGIHEGPDWQDDMGRAEIVSEAIEAAEALNL